MMNTIMSALLAGVVGLAVHFGQAWLSRYVNLLKKMRSLARIRSEPYYQVGAYIIRAIDPASGTVICEHYRIDELSVGRVLLRCVDDSTIVIPMTCMEFEALHVTVQGAEAEKEYPQ